jgi:hypothetical protein
MGCQTARGTVLDYSRSQQRRALRNADSLEAPAGVEAAEGSTVMTDDPIEIVNGSGKVFRDFGYPDADARQPRRCSAPRS